MIRALLFSGPDVEQSCVTARADSNLCFTPSNRRLGIVFALRSIATSDLRLSHRNSLCYNYFVVSEKYRWKRRKLQSMKQSRKSLKAFYWRDLAMFQCMRYV
ncbi:unnamed protein product [Brassica oleracea var. botrytis]